MVQLAEIIIQLQRGVKFWRKGGVTSLLLHTVQLMAGYKKKASRKMHEEVGDPDPTSSTASG